MRCYCVVFAVAVFSCLSFQANAQTKYEYDALGRLVEVERVGAAKTKTYSYGDAGNRTSVSQATDAGDFSINDVSITEGGILSFTVSKAGGGTFTHDVSYATSNGSAGSGDYTVSSGVLSFAPVDTSKSITVQTTQDSVFEGAETVIVTLSNPTNGATIADGQGIGTINDDDSGPSFSINDVTVTEGGSATFTVTKTGSTVLSHNINYASGDISATAGSDYTAKSGTLTFASGETSKTITIVTTNDAVRENLEYFMVNLSGATNGAAIADTQGLAGINDNDPAPSFTINNVTVAEGATATFTVTKSGATDLSHNINYATANSSASGNDYTAKSGTLTFAAGEVTKTISVSTTNDSIYENTENFLVNLSGATNGATIADSQGIGGINDNDTAPSFSVNNASRIESQGSITFTVTKTGSTALTHNVNYATAPNTASTGDYSSRSGTLSFTSGQTSKTVSVPITDDIIQESSETFYLNLSASTNSATISDSQGVGTIHDDDCPMSCI